MLKHIVSLNVCVFAKQETTRSNMHKHITIHIHQWLQDEIECKKSFEDERNWGTRVYVRLIIYNHTNTSMCTDGHQPYCVCAQAGGEHEGWHNINHICSSSFMLHSYSIVKWQQHSKKSVEYARLPMSFDSKIWMMQVPNNRAQNTLNTTCRGLLANVGQISLPYTNQ